MSPIEHPLDFERPLVELEYQLERLKDELASGNASRREEYAALEVKVSKIRKDIYGKLTPYQRVQLSRHFDRPFSLDYIKFIFTDFVELHGDRLFRDDPAIVGGTARLGEVPVMIVGHQRGRTTATTFSDNHADYWNGELGELKKISGDRLCLSALFSLETRERSLRINEGDKR